MVRVLFAQFTNDFYVYTFLTDYLKGMNANLFKDI